MMKMIHNKGPSAKFKKSPINLQLSPLIIDGLIKSKNDLFNQKNSWMLCIGVNKIKIHFDTSQLCCGVVH
jgi:hypothetical protein